MQTRLIRKFTSIIEGYRAGRRRARILPCTPGSEDEGHPARCGTRQQAARPASGRWESIEGPLFPSTDGGLQRLPSACHIPKARCRALGSGCSTERWLDPWRQFQAPASVPGFSLWISGQMALHHGDAGPAPGVRCVDNRVPGDHSGRGCAASIPSSCRRPDLPVQDRDRRPGESLWHSPRSVHSGLKTPPSDQACSFRLQERTGAANGGGQTRRRRAT